MLMVIPGSDISRHVGLMDRVFRFRHYIFVEGKAWTDLRRPDGLERDQFDDENAIYQICLRDDEIVGYDHARAVTLIPRTMHKALFAGRPDDVVFGLWSTPTIAAGRFAPPWTSKSMACRLSSAIGPGSAEPQQSEESLGRSPGFRSHALFAASLPLFATPAPAVRTLCFR